MVSQEKFEVETEYQRFLGFLDGSSKNFSLEEFDRGSSNKDEHAETLPSSSEFINTLLFHHYLALRSIFWTLNTEESFRWSEILNSVLRERMRLLADPDLFPTLNIRFQFTNFTRLIMGCLYKVIDAREAHVDELRELDKPAPGTPWEQYLRNQEDQTADIVQILTNGSYSLLLAWQYEMRVIRAGINASASRQNLLLASQQERANALLAPQTSNQKIPHKPDVFKADMSFDLNFHNLKFNVTPIFQRPLLPDLGPGTNMMPLAGQPMYLESATEFLNTVLGGIRGIRVRLAQGSWFVRIEGSRVSSESNN